MLRISIVITKYSQNHLEQLQTAKLLPNPQFREQVEWELNAQQQASLIAMYFAPATKAPITLLELGLFAATGKVIVCCPAGYWRRGNVEVVCARFGLPLVEDIAGLIQTVRERLTD